MLSRVIAAAALAAGVVVVPAHAGADQEAVSVNHGLAGSILVIVLGPSGRTMVGQCSSAGVFTPNNRLHVAFGGHAEAVGPQSTQLTYVKCSVSNQDAQSDSSEFANGGPVSQTAKTTSPWKLSPVTVCVEGFAVFGPTPVTVITMLKQCNTVIP